MAIHYWDIFSIPAQFIVLFWRPPNYNEFCFENKIRTYAALYKLNVLCEYDFRGR